MSLTAYFNFLLIAGVIQGFTFNIGTFLSRKRIKKPVLFLNLVVVFLSLNNLQAWLIDKGFISSIFFIKHFMVPWYMGVLPMFYAFLIFYLGIEKKRWPYFIISGFLFLVELIARSIMILLVQRELLDIESLALYNFIEEIINLSYSLFILVKAFLLLYKYEDLYKTILAFDDLNWVKRFIKLGGVVFLLWIFAVIANNFSETIKPPYSYYPLRLSTSILLYWIGYQGFFRYVILKDRIVLRSNIRDGRIIQKSALQNSLQYLEKTEKQEGVFNNINSYIQENQNYLDPYLSLEKLAKELHMSTSRLSELVNRYSKHNFSDYINKLRIEEAKKLLADVNFAFYTMAAIGLECGFNSKSTFYSAFKKFTSQTPSEYRDQHF